MLLKKLFNKTRIISLAAVLATLPAYSQETNNLSKIYPQKIDLGIYERSMIGIYTRDISSIDDKFQEGYAVRYILWNNGGEGFLVRLELQDEEGIKRGEKLIGPLKANEQGYEIKFFNDNKTEEKLGQGKYLLKAWIGTNLVAKKNFTIVPK